MLCETQTDGSGNVTGVGPAELEWPQCSAPCCGGGITIQIRVRYRTGYAKLCAANVDPDGDPDSYFTEKIFERVYHKFASGVEVGSCTYTVTSACPNAIVSGSSGEADCACSEDDYTQSPSDCMDHLYDFPVTSVTSDPPEISYSGEMASKDDTRSAAIAAMAYGDWSEWTDLVTIDLAGGTSSAGYLTNFLAEATCGDNGADAGSFIATGAQYESELRVLGAHPVSIAVSEGTDIETAPVNRYTIDAGGTRTFTVSAPSFSSGWVTDKCVLRCACPVRYAASS